MNQVVKHEPKAALVAGGDVAAIVPRTLEETFRLANALSSSGMVPSSLSSPEKVMVAIMAGAELGLPPFQALQSFAVINGKPAIWGDGLMAVVRSQGFKVREWMEGEGEGLIARCEVTRPDNGEVTPGEFSVADAKKAGLWGKAGPWQQYPKRMLKMRARAVAERDGAADVLRGFQIREEVEDYVEVRHSSAPQPTGLRGRLQAAEREREGFSAVRAAEDAEAIEAEVEETSVDARLDGDDLPPGLKTGAQLLAEQEAAGAADQTQGPDTADEAENAATDADFEPADAPEDLFPGDRPPTPSTAEQGGGGAKNPAADAPAKPTLASRVNAVKAAMAKVADQQSLDAIWDRCAALRKELEAKDPEGLFVDLQDARDAMANALEATRG